MVSPRRFLKWKLILGGVVVPAYLSASVFTFSSGAPISIDDATTASPYPATLTASGVTGTVTKVTVTLLNLTHSFLDDIAVLLLGPGGQSVLLFDGLGAVDSVVSVDLTFDDAAPTQLTSPVVTGSYQPGLDLYGDTFSPPAPLRPYGTTMSVFNGITANGPWMLFIQDFVTGSNGSLGDWRIDITTLDDVPEPAPFALAGAGLLVFAVVRFCPSSWTPKVRRYLTFTKTTVSSKGQIVLPAEFRRMDRVEPGQEFDAERLERGDNRLSPLLQQ
jgi:subtilisin-like proprotein convertase family protein